MGQNQPFKWERPLKARIHDQLPPLVKWTTCLVYYFWYLRANYPFLTNSPFLGHSFTTTTLVCRLHSLFAIPLFPSQNTTTSTLYHMNLLLFTIILTTEATSRSYHNTTNKYIYTYYCMYECIYLSAWSIASTPLHKIFYSSYIASSHSPRTFIFYLSVLQLYPKCISFLYRSAAAPRVSFYQ